jgi:3-deoxy-D-manno-octulosonic-acid transferase
VSCREDLTKTIRMLLKDPVNRSELGVNAKRVIAKNRGATKKNLEKISEILR